MFLAQVVKRRFELIRDQPMRTSRQQIYDRPDNRTDVQNRTTKTTVVKLFIPYSNKSRSAPEGVKARAHNLLKKNNWNLPRAHIVEIGLGHSERPRHARDAPPRPTRKSRGDRAEGCESEAE